MLRKIFNSAIMPALIVMLGACAKTNDVPDFAQPSIVVNTDNETIDGINIGPDRDYEQESSVTYRLTVTSSRKLSKFTVVSSADAFDRSSKLVKTIPADAIDLDGNFKGNINNVVIYYEYHIHGNIAPKTTEVLTFTIMDESSNTGFVSASHVVIKKGSTQGRLLRVIDMPYTNEAKGLAIGSQDNIMYSFETDGNMSPDRNVSEQRGPFFSLTHAMDVNYGVDAVRMAEDIDFIGYRVNGNTVIAGNLTPILVNNAYYLTSPSDSLCLLSAYPGIYHRIRIFGSGQGVVRVTYGGLVRDMVLGDGNLSNVIPPFVANYAADYAAIGVTVTNGGQRSEFQVRAKPDGSPNEGRFDLYRPPVFEIISGTLSAVLYDTRDWLKVNALRRTMEEFYKKLKDEGKPVKTVKFLRLDNIAGAGRVTPEYFDALTHDNEFDALLADVETNGIERAGPILLNQVWGFATSDGKRGMIRTSPATWIISTGVSANVPAPNTTNNNLYGSIKYQESKQ
jgi:hypothetical protein